MAWPVYSERFIRKDGGPGVIRYWVPSGHRAVITSICSMNFSQASCATWVGISDTPFWWHQYQAIKTSRIDNMRAVAYAGESIDCYVEAAGCRTIVCGFLFATPEIGFSQAAVITEEGGVFAGGELDQKQNGLGAL